MRTTIIYSEGLFLVAGYWRKTLKKQLLLKKIFLISFCQRAVSLGVLEKSFMERFCPKPSIEKKELMCWVYDFLEFEKSTTNYNKIYAVRRAISTRFLVQQDYKSWFFIDWEKFGKTFPELNDEIQKRIKDGENNG